MKRGLFFYLLLAGWLAWSCAPAWSQCVGGQCYRNMDGGSVGPAAAAGGRIQHQATTGAHGQMRERAAGRIPTVVAGSQAGSSPAPSTGPLRRLIARIRARRMR